MAGRVTDVFSLFNPLTQFLPPDGRSGCRNQGEEKVPTSPNSRCSNELVVGKVLDISSRRFFEPKLPPRPIIFGKSPWRKESSNYPLDFFWKLETPGLTRQTRGKPLVSSLFRITQSALWFLPSGILYKNAPNLSKQGCPMPYETLVLKRSLRRRPDSLD